MLRYTYRTFDAIGRFRDGQGRPLLLPLPQRVPLREQPLLHGFDFYLSTTVNTTERRSSEEELTESDVSRMVPGHGKIPHHAPQVLNSDIPPSSPRFTFTIQTPNLLHLAPEIFPEELLEPVSVVPKSSSKDNEIRIESAAVFESQPGLGELLDGGVVLESDLPIDDHLASSDIYKDGGQEKRGRSNQADQPK